MGLPRSLFCLFFVLFKHKFYRKNCRCQQDSNSESRSRRRARWPLDHHHGLNIHSLFDWKSLFNFLWTSVNPVMVWGDNFRTEIFLYNFYQVTLTQMVLLTVRLVYSLIGLDSVSSFVAYKREILCFEKILYSLT